MPLDPTQPPDPTSVESWLEIVQLFDESHDEPTSLRPDIVDGSQQLAAKQLEQGVSTHRILGVPDGTLEIAGKRDRTENRGHVSTSPRLGTPPDPTFSTAVVRIR